MIIITDVDKTLLSPGRRESATTIEIFRRANGAGALIGLATSRPLSSLRADMPTVLELADFMICADGAYTLVRACPGDDLLLHHRNLLEEPAAIWRRLRDSIDLRDMTAFVFLDDQTDYRVCVAGADPASEFVQSVVGARPMLTLAESTEIERLLGGVEGRHVLSLGVLAVRKLIEAVHHDTNEWGSHLSVRTYPELRFGGPEKWWLDITSSNCDKFFALTRFLHDRLEVSDRIVMLCDGENDVALATHADVVFCPPWAVASIRQLPHARTLAADDCDEFIEAAADHLFGGSALRDD